MHAIGHIIVLPLFFKKQYTNQKNTKLEQVIFAVKINKKNNDWHRVKQSSGDTLCRCASHSCPIIR